MSLREVEHGIARSTVALVPQDNISRRVISSFGQAATEGQVSEAGQPRTAPISPIANQEMGRARAWCRIRAFKNGRGHGSVGGQYKCHVPMQHEPGVYYTYIPNIGRDHVWSYDGSWTAVRRE